MTPDQLSDELKAFNALFAKLKLELGKAIVGYDDLLTEVLAAIFGGGHVLLEGVPGLGKTHLVKTLSTAVGLQPGRVQCTPDLMPADILGTHIVDSDASGKRSLRFEKGPVFSNILLVDEINRATPKTQAALLEVMQEHHVTAGSERLALPEPFFVLATQNPMEMEGTYPLPEAQLDRFMFKLRVPFPDLASLVEISERTTGSSTEKVGEVTNGEEILRFQNMLTYLPVARDITEYAARLVLGTHPNEGEKSSETVRRYVAYGSSPRGLQALIRGARVHAALAGATAVGTSHIKAVAKSALRHRTILNFEGEAEGTDVDNIVDDIVSTTTTPADAAA